MDKIREYRNGIYSFQDRTIGDWDEYIHSVKIFAWFLIDIYNRFPDIGDDIVFKEVYLKPIGEADDCCYNLKFHHSY